VNAALCFCFAVLPLAAFSRAQEPAKQPVSPEEAQAIDSLTAPIALYPDALVAQILTASKNYEGLKSFAAWMKSKPELKGTELQDAAYKAGFDASFVALAPFTQVVEMMVQKPDWTRQLGQTFTSNRTAVFDSIQRLRAEAQAAGNLKTTEQQKVQAQTTSEGQQVIVIEPANPQVVYVPSYNPQTVYVSSPNYGATAAAGAIGFTAGVILGASSDHYYYGPWGWHGAALYDEVWDEREDFLEDAWDRREDYREDRQDRYEQRQSTAQDRREQRQTTTQDRQAQRQTTTQDRQAQRETTSQDRQAHRETGRQDRQGERQTAAATSSLGGGQFASQRSGMSSSSFSNYDRGSAARTQSMRGSASLGSRGGGFRGGGRRR
jgi:hypothetical protein